MSAPAMAEPKAVSDTGFTVIYETTVPAKRPAVWAALLNPLRWWNSSHSWSGKAANLSLEAKAGGCFCELLPGEGFVEHARVIHARRDTLLRLSGALGPLQGEAVAGTLSFALAPGASPGTTKLTVTYVVGGYITSGVRGFAKPVDFVIGEQVGRLSKLLGGGPVN